MKIKQTTPQAPNGNVRPISTLIVDDSALMRRCLRDLLAMQEGLQVVGTANNGSEALKEAEALTPDLVLMDLHMPVMGGLKAAAELRSRLPDTRIIIMTMEEAGPAKAAARAHGAHGFIHKEMLASNLMPEIHRVFRLKRSPVQGDSL